jgi:pantothenate kinase type III
MDTMKTFTFTDDKEINETKQERSFKKAVKSFQNTKKELKQIRIKYTNKKGTAIDRWVKLPIGRKKRLG